MLRGVCPIMLLSWWAVCSNQHCRQCQLPCKHTSWRFRGPVCADAWIQ
jgi:hypothetical protein